MTDSVLIVDFGSQVTQLIARRVREAGVFCEIVPFDKTTEGLARLQPKGIILSGGPASVTFDHTPRAPQAVFDAGLPILGICLGHQLLALASGAKTMKMGHGHHGANHPVQDIAKGTVMITSQNHGFAVDETTLPANVEATHKSLFDGTLQGIRRTDKPAYSFQGHPEASPGPHDVAPLFDEFIQLMEARSA